MDRIKFDGARIMWAFPFFGSFLVYLITLSPTVTFWDSGELISASWLLGISHQPGYPILSVIGKLFSFLPFGNIAFRMNLLSAFFSSLSLVILYFILVELSDEKGPTRASLGAAPTVWKDESFLAALAALLPAFTQAYWSQAVVTKPLALNSFFISMLVYIWVVAARGKLSPGKYFALSGFVFGLGLVNHQSLILYAPALVISWFLYPLPSVGEGRERGIENCRRFTLALLSLFFIALGLSVYLYLPIRAAAGPVMDLGHPDNFSRFAWTVKWGEYFRAGIPINNLIRLISKMRFLTPPILVGAPVALVFIYRALRRDWRLYLPMLVFLLVYFLGISMRTMGDESDRRFGLAAKFYIPVFIMVVPFIYAEAAELIGKKNRPLPRPLSHERARGEGSYPLPSVGEGRERGNNIWAGLTVLIFAAVIIVLLYRNFYYENNSQHFFAFDYAQNSLKSAGEKGVLFTWGDNGAFPLWYLHDVERYRDDAVVIHAPLMTYDWYLRDVNNWLGKDIKFMDPYFLGENVYRVFKAVTPEKTVAYDYSTVKFLSMDVTRLRARGLVYFEGAMPPGSSWKFYIFRGVDDPNVYKGPMEENIIQIYNYQRQVAGQESKADSSLRSE